MSKYTPPQLSGHTVLFKGTRYYVFKVSKDHPFEGYEDGYTVLVYDKLYGTVVGFCSDELVGICNPSTFQESLPLKAKDVRDLVSQVDFALEAFDRYMR